MRYVAALIAIWILTSFTSNLRAQDFKQQAQEIMRSGLPQPEKIDSLYQVSFQYYHQDYAFFRQVADTILSLSRKAGYRAGTAKGLLMLSFISGGRGQLDAMRQYEQEAMTYIPASPASRELAAALFSEGNYFRRKKRDKEATETFIKSLRVAKEAGDKKIEAYCNTSLGIMHVGRGDFEKALKYYDEALVIALLIDDQRHIQRIYTNRGIVYMRQQKYKEAIRSHQQALAMARNQHDERNEAFVYNDLGATYLKSGDQLPVAIRYLKKSVAMRERLNEKEEIAYTYNYLGQAYGKAGNNKEAIGWLEKSLQVSKAIGNNKQQYEALEELATQYSHFRQYDSAYHYLREYNIFRDSLRKMEQAEAIAGLTVQYETEKKEQAIALLTQENRIQQLDIRQRNLYLSIAGLLVAGAIVTLWQLYRAKKVKEEKLKKEAVMQAELLQLEASNTLQSDRLRIAKDLHDNIGANLTFIQTAIEDSVAAHKEWQDLQGLVSETITELRRTVWLINRPSVPMDEWLVKLREYYRKIRKIAIITEVEDESQVLSSRQATLILRIIQEATNNSLKHSGAANIVVSVKADKKLMQISIEDDGKGFDQDSIRQGMGLENMRQNSRELPGTFSLESLLNKGTRITVQFHWLPDTQ